MLNSVLLIVILIVVLSPNNSSGGAEDKQFSNGVCSSLCSPVCITLDSSCFSNCYNYCDTQQGFVRPASLGSWILPQAIQHVGVTTSNLSRSVKFYTEIMGG